MSTNGLILRTNLNFTDNTLPVYQNDSILTTGNGSLFLADVRTLPSGVPVHGQAINNLAATQAAAIGISGDSSGSFRMIGTPVSSGYALLERSGKGGIHCIFTNAQTVSTSQGFRVQIPMNIMNYMINNRNNTFYVSQWRALTRAASTTSPDGAKCTMGIETGNTSGWGRMVHTSSQLKPGGADLVGSNLSVTRNTVGNAYESIAGRIPSTDTLSSTTFNSDSVSRDVAQWGKVGAQNNYPPNSGLPSMIFYRGYIEDLTVSGRTFTQVDAIDKALYDAAFASGGRFNGDTYTAVSTLP